MKVFVNYRNGGYSGGMILVAANSAEEAHEAFHKDEQCRWMFTVWSDEYYYREGWKLMPMLEANVDKRKCLQRQDIRNDYERDIQIPCKEISGMYSDWNRKRRNSHLIGVLVEYSAKGVLLLCDGMAYRDCI